MYISIELEDCNYNSDLVHLVFYRHTFKGHQEYINGLSKLSAIPKYQAFALQKALKDADPKLYPSCTLTVLSGGLHARSAEN